MSIALRSDKTLNDEDKEIVCSMLQKLEINDKKEVNYVKSTKSDQEVGNILTKTEISSTVKKEIKVTKGNDCYSVHITDTKISAKNGIGILSTSDYKKCVTEQTYSVK